MTEKTSTSIDSRITHFPTWWGSRVWNIRRALLGGTAVDVEYDGTYEVVVQLGTLHEHRISGYRILDEGCTTPYSCELPMEIDTCAGERYQHNTSYVEVDPDYAKWLQLATPVNVGEAVAEAVEFGARQVIALMAASEKCEPSLVVEAAELATQLGQPMAWRFPPSHITDYREPSALIEAAMRAL